MNTLWRALGSKPRGVAPAILLALLSASGARAADDGAWYGLAPPAGRYDHVAFYDSTRDRMVVALGGYSESFVYNFDVWSRAFGATPTWSQIRPSGSGFGGPAGDMVYDPTRDRVARASASSSVLTSIEFSGAGAWTTTAIAGTPPPSDRFGYGAIYDAGADRIVYFGGRIDDTTFVNDAWAVDLSGTPTWAAISPAGPRPDGRTGFSLAYDPVGARMILFGGYKVLPDYTVVWLSDVWTLSLAGPPAWTEITPSGTAPDARSGAAVMFDPPRNRMLMQGGSSHDATLWSLSLGATPAWSALATTGPAPAAVECGHSMVYDSRRDLVLFYGGLRVTAYPNSHPSSELRVFDPASNGWTALSDARPAPRHEHTAIYDAPRQRMIVFGGNAWEGGALADTWSLSMSGAAPWVDLAPSGSPPARRGHSAIVDPVRERMIVFGGYAGGGCANDLWSLDLAGSPSWTPLAPLGTPPPARAGHTAIYDPAGDRMIVFGGLCGTACLNDVWQLALSGTPTWSEVLPAGTPPAARFWHSAIDDPVNARMLIYGGTGPSPPGGLWQLSLTGTPGWQELTPPGTSPGTRAAHGAAYDPARQRMLVFGGGAEATFNSNATWALSLGQAPQWSALAPGGPRPAARCKQSVIFDAANDRMVIYGGEKCSGIEETVDHDNAWALTFEGVVSVPLVSRQELELAPAAPNPAAGDVTFSFTLARAASVRLAVYDLAGRRRAEPFTGPLPAGRHEVRWSRDARASSGLGPGLYFYELRVGDQRTARRIVILE